jgi:hypothetical protein
MNYEFTTLYSIIEYVTENFVGIILLILAFFIIYIVDHINNLNSIMTSSIPQLSIPQVSSAQILNNKVKTKKVKKH